jgi:hypothetical protein
MKVLTGLAAPMSILLDIAVPAYADVVDLPDEWRVKLGLQEATPDPTCPGLTPKGPVTPHTVESLPISALYQR